MRCFVVHSRCRNSNLRSTDDVRIRAVDIEFVLRTRTLTLDSYTITFGLTWSLPENVKEVLVHGFERVDPSGLELPCEERHHLTISKCMDLSIEEF